MHHHHRHDYYRHRIPLKSLLNNANDASDMNLGSISSRIMLIIISHELFGECNCLSDIPCAVSVNENWCSALFLVDDMLCWILLPDWIEIDTEQTWTTLIETAATTTEAAAYLIVTRASQTMLNDILTASVHLKNIDSFSFAIFFCHLACSTVW